MRLRWSNPMVVTALVVNLIILLVGCSSNSNFSASATGRRNPPPTPVPTAVEALSEEAEIPELLGFVEPESGAGPEGRAVLQSPVPTVTLVNPDAVPAPFAVNDGQVAQSEVPSNRLPAPSDSTLRIGIAGFDLAAVRPGNASSAAELIVADMVHDGLTTTIPSTNAADTIVVGELADLWGTIDDANHWEFLLRSRTFPDGSAINAEAVKKSFSSTVSANPQSGAARLLSTVEGWASVAEGSAATLSGIEVIDDFTLRFRLTQPDSAFDQTLADPRLGIINPVDLAQGSSAWVYEGVLGAGMSFTHREYDDLEFNRIDIVLYPGEVELVDAYSVGALDVVVLGAGDENRLLWKSDIAPIASRPDGTFDVLGVTRRQR